MKNTKEPLLGEQSKGDKIRDSFMNNMKSKMLSSTKDDDAPDLTYSTQSIDFKDMLINHKQRTEKSLPFTLHNVEDVIFIDGRHLISLEYIYYQKRDGNYFSIKPESQTSSKMLKPLGTESYDNKQKKNHIKAFRSMPVNFEINRQVSYLEEMKEHFIETDYEDDYVVVEALLCIYRITPTGQIEQEKQISFSYDQKFHPTKEGKMKLRLSQDRSIVSLSMQQVNHKQNLDYFNQYGDESEDSESSGCGEIIGQQGEVNRNAKIQILAWDSKTLRPIQIEDKLKKNLKEQPMGMLRQLMFVGQNNYLLQVLQMHKHIKISNEKIKWLQYTIFDFSTGRKLMEFDNFSPGEKIRCIGFLIYDELNRFTCKEARGQTEAHQKSLTLKRTSGKESKMLDLCFFYVVDDNSEVTNEMTKKRGYREVKQCFNKFINLKDLVNKSMD